MRVHDSGVQLSEFAVPVVVRNDRDTCHAPPCHTLSFLAIDWLMGGNGQATIRDRVEACW